MIYRTTKNKNTSKYINGVTVTENNLTYENGSVLPVNMSIMQDTKLIKSATIINYKEVQNNLSSHNPKGV